MGKGDSESSTTSTASTTNQDLRVGAEGGGVALGQSAQLEYNYSYTNEFSDAVSNAFNKILDFSAGALAGARDIVNKAIEAGEKSTNSVVASSEKAVDAANKTAISGLNPSQAAANSILDNIVPIGIIGAIVVIALNFFKRK